ncbi:LytR/AlgR family response regulator transcription factor [Flagellimonas onchidii]|uniref:LytR/AlgR family response regulator transcription factor n=1 Tax=Flagellimonas onchidii TaxID=2562684 RepID=UPI0010A62834|nr:LytTR family transcriptional regulator DNA-binding domain-containing protein [Allomuricauda onchidii]
MCELRLAFIDNDICFINQISNYIKNSFENIKIVAVVSNLQEIEAKIISTAPQLLFSNITLDNFATFPYIEKVQSVIKFHAIFFTECIDLIFRTLNVRWINHIVKPVDYCHLHKLISKIQQRELLNKNLYGMEKSDIIDFMVLPKKDKILFIKIKEVCYLKGMGKGTIAHTVHGDRYITNQYNLKFYQNILWHYGFFRVHNSYLVNKFFISQLKNSYCVVNGDKVPFSRRRRKDILNEISLPSKFDYVIFNKDATI